MLRTSSSIYLPKPAAFLNCRIGGQVVYQPQQLEVKENFHKKSEAEPEILCIDSSQNLWLNPRGNQAPELSTKELNWGLGH